MKTERARCTRANLTRAFLRRMETHTPDVVRRIQIQILMNTTADAFGEKSESVMALPADEALRKYASCTEKWSRKKGIRPDILYRKAQALGSRVRHMTGFTEPEDLRRLLFWMYRNIGITMEGALPGEILIPHCYFSAFYTPARCRLMSAMDAGVITGLCGGGKLRFTERITEGCARCAARYTI